MFYKALSIIYRKHYIAPWIHHCSYTTQVSEWFCEFSCVSCEFSCIDIFINFVNHARQFSMGFVFLQLPFEEITSKFGNRQYPTLRSSITKIYLRSVEISNKRIVTLKKKISNERMAREPEISGEWPEISGEWPERSRGTQWEGTAVHLFLYVRRSLTRFEKYIS